jgi:hypothetical protein
MNERIRELANQAGAEVKIIHGDMLYISKADLDLEKFAELIVEECRYVMDCNKGSDQHTEWNRALSETSNKILEHFGVEE